MEPKLSAAGKEMGETPGSVASNATRAVQDLRDAVGRHIPLRANSAALMLRASSSSAKCSPGIVMMAIHSPSDGQQSQRLKALLPGRRKPSNPPLIVEDSYVEFGG